MRDGEALEQEDPLAVPQLDAELQRDAWGEAEPMADEDAVLCDDCDDEGVSVVEGDGVLEAVPQGLTLLETDAVLQSLGAVDGVPQAEAVALNEGLNDALELAHVEREGLGQLVGLFERDATAVTEPDVETQVLALGHSEALGNTVAEELNEAQPLLVEDAKVL